MVDREGDERVAWFPGEDDAERDSGEGWLRVSILPPAAAVRGVLALPGTWIDGGEALGAAVILPLRVP